jgi:hypothetical protein
MRTITNVYNVYTIEELTGVNRTAALESVARQREEEFKEFGIESLRSQLEFVACGLGANVTSLRVQPFGRSSIEIEMKPGANRTHEEAIRGLTWVLQREVVFAESDILSDGQNEQYAKDNELEFCEDGTIYNGGDEDDD